MLPLTLLVVRAAQGGSAQTAADWIALVLAFASGVATTLLAEWFARRRDRTTSGRRDIQAAQDVLIELRAAYRRREESGTDPDDSTIAQLCDRWDVAASRIASREVSRLGSDYKHVGGLYAGRDPLTGVSHESAAFDVLMGELSDGLTD